MEQMIDKLNKKRELSIERSTFHRWIRKRKPKSKFCERCKTNKPYDLANISQKYKRDINDFKWLCRKCHMEEDGRINNILAWNKGLPKEMQPRYGKKHSNKSKEKIRQSHNRLGTNFRYLGKLSWEKNQKEIDEHRKNISIAKRKCNQEQIEQIKKLYNDGVKVNDINKLFKFKSSGGIYKYIEKSNRRIKPNATTRN